MKKAYLIRMTTIIWNTRHQCEERNEIYYSKKHHGCMVYTPFSDDAMHFLNEDDAHKVFDYCNKVVADFDRVAPFKRKKDFTFEVVKVDMTDKIKNIYKGAK